MSSPIELPRLLVWSVASAASTWLGILLSTTASPGAEILFGRPVAVVFLCLCALLPATAQALLLLGTKTRRVLWALTSMAGLTAGYFGTLALLASVGYRPSLHATVPIEFALWGALRGVAQLPALWRARFLWSWPAWSSAGLFLGSTTVLSLSRAQPGAIPNSWLVAVLFLVDGMVTGIGLMKLLPRSAVTTKRTELPPHAVAEGAGR